MDYHIPENMRRDYKKAKTSVSGWWAVLLLLFSIFLVAFFFDQFTSLTTVAHAEEKPVSFQVRQNDYYCQQLKDSSAVVKGASYEQVRALCKTYGINL